MHQCHFSRVNLSNFHSSNAWFYVDSRANLANNFTLENLTFFLSSATWCFDWTRGCLRVNLVIIQKSTMLNCGMWMEGVRICNILKPIWKIAKQGTIPSLVLDFTWKDTLVPLNEQILSHAIVEHWKYISKSSIVKFGVNQNITLSRIFFTNWQFFEHLHINRL